MTAPSRDVPWYELANCQGVGDAMYPEKGDSGTTVKAFRVCRSCDVVTECLRAAIRDGDEFGIRGGLTAGDRIRVRQGRSPLLACSCGMPMAPKTEASTTCRLCAQHPPPVEPDVQGKATCAVCDKDVPVDRGRLVRHWMPGESGKRGDPRCVGRGA